MAPRRKNLRLNNLAKARAARWSKGVVTIKDEGLTQKSQKRKRSPPPAVDRCSSSSCGPTAPSASLQELVEHHGGCHCGAVQFKVLAPEIVDVFECNCSICTKKQNIHFIVPKANFTLLKGEDNITTYTFNKKLAKHTFCKTCGVQSFYSPRSNPDGFGVMPHCIDSGTIKRTNVKKFDGQNWEDSFTKSNISKYSKSSDKPG